MSLVILVLGQGQIYLKALNKMCNLPKRYRSPKIELIYPKIICNHSLRLVSFS